MKLTINYKKYLIEVESKYGNVSGGGWYDEKGNLISHRY